MKEIVSVAVAFAACLFAITMFAGIFDKLRDNDVTIVFLTFVGVIGLPGMFYYVYIGALKAMGGNP